MVHGAIGVVNKQSERIRDWRTARPTFLWFGVLVGSDLLFGIDVAHCLDNGSVELNEVV